jgi:hypothetical protein
MRHALAVVAAALPLTFVATANATTVANVVCDVERVVLEPSETAPTHIQIHGAFALAEGGPGAPYSAPVRGYLYLACPAGREADCKTHFADIKKALGSTQCAGIGQAGEALPRVRADGVTPASPDTYSFGIGVLLSEWHGGACAKAKALPDTVTPDAGVPDTATAADTGTAPAADTGTATPAAPAPAESSGCSMGGSSAGGAGIALIAMIGLAIRRRLTAR